MRTRVHIVVLPAVLIFLSCATSGWAQSRTTHLRTAAKHLNEWNLRGAQQTLNKLSDADRATPHARHLLGWHSFLNGNYEQARQHLVAATTQQPQQKLWLARLQLIQNTLEVTGGFKEIPSSKGHFIFRVRPGIDEVLIPYASEALETAYDVLGEELRLRPEDPIRVEILDSVQALAEVSPLKLSEIKTSGTIALCHFNRLILVSPRALVYGYRWIDTLVHEYVHYVVAHRTAKRTPIWFDEGLAKYFENRWRNHVSDPLSRVDEDRLATALRRKSLIRFRAMSPSIAKLPSQQDAALAYAQVFTLVKLLMEKSLPNGINDVLQNIRNGKTARKAIGQAIGKSFSRFEKEWKKSLYSRGLRRLPFSTTDRKHYRDTHAPTDELKDIKDKKTRSLAYLGDRLVVKKRFLAASKEYEKALQLAGGPEPIVSAKLANTLLKQGKHKRAIEVIGPAVRLNRHHVLLYLYRGKARLAVGDYEAAKDDLIEAVRINPFDPEVHDLLANVLAKLGFEDEAELELRQQRLVMAH